jgi:hypothetical protein
MNNIGMRPMNTINKAGPEALPSISSLAYWYTYVAKVSKLKGLSNRVIGNSLIISTKAKIVAVSIDGLIRGSIIFIKLKPKGFPKVRLASIMLGGILLIPLLIAPNATALNLET